MEDRYLSLVDGARRDQAGLPLAEPLFLQFPAPVQSDDAMLDGWLASLTPSQFERILDSLARQPIATAASAS